MSYGWFRMYADIIDDPKVESLTHEQRWLWITVLCLASRSPIRGYLLLSKERSPERSLDVAGTETQHHPVPIRIIAKKAELSVAEVEAGLVLFESLEMMDRDAQGVWHLSNWERRQFKSDDVTARTRRYKDKSKEEERNGNVPESVPGNVPGNGDGTPQITDNRLQNKRESTSSERPRAAGTGKPGKGSKIGGAVDHVGPIAQRVARHLRSLCEEHGFVMDTSDQKAWLAFVGKVKTQIRGGADKPEIPEQQALDALTWGFAQAYHRDRFLGSGALYIRSCWVAWRKVPGHGADNSGGQRSLLEEMEAQAGDD